MFFLPRIRVATRALVGSCIRRIALPTCPPAETPDPAPAAPGRFPAKVRPSASVQREPYHAGAPAGASAGLELGEIAQSKDAMHDEAGAQVRPRAGRTGPASRWSRPTPRLGLCPRNAGEVDASVEIAANVGDAEVPRLASSAHCHRRHRDDFAGVGQPDQPLRSGARQPEPRLLDLRRRLGGEARSRAPAETRGDRVWRRGPWRCASRAR